ncbi:hypothetical protein BDB01DRAFT_332721 [Pilobolus umbonatus]|nr:hypothetical protein BDB01DRAFT_332721 [Pilobolus umbonatus]
MVCSLLKPDMIPHIMYSVTMLVLSTDLKEAYGHMQSVLDLSLEKLRLESKLRVEQFKMEEEKRLTESMDQVKMENRILWTKVVELSKEPEKTESSDEIAEDVIVKKNTKPNHVRFQSIEHVANSPRTKGFHLDENAIMSLSNKNLDSQVKIYADDSEGNGSYGIMGITVC